MRTSLLLTVALVTAVFGCRPPVMNTPVDEIPKLTSLKEVMDNQATVADPEMAKRGATSYSDADWAAFTNLSTRLQATSAKIKDFSRGPDFDALAARLGDKAKALGAAADAKDAAKASAALGEMKATCKECHSKFR